MTVSQHLSRLPPRWRLRSVTKSHSVNRLTSNKRRFSTFHGKPSRPLFRYGIPAGALLTTAVMIVANYSADTAGRPWVNRWIANRLGDQTRTSIGDSQLKYLHSSSRCIHSTPTDPARHNQNPLTAAAPDAAKEDCPGEDSESLADKVTSLILPDWMRLIPAYLTKLQNELSMAPGSLADEIWEDARDPYKHPETAIDAHVRISDDISEEEKQFLQNRNRFTRKGLAKYLGIREQDIHPDDVPIIAICGSGGGLRALVAGSSSYLSASKDGLLDCVTYTAGVSGSCWLQALYYSSLTKQNWDELVEHLKARLGVHIAFPPAVMSLLTSAPTKKYLLAGVWEKTFGKNADFGIVDLYGLLLGARLMVPKNELTIEDEDLKLSNQKQYIKNGQNPLPIYTAVRHEIPTVEQMAEKAKSKTKSSPSFQWFEFTPYELWCEEWGAGIPTWAVGRHFHNGHSVTNNNGLYLPEQRIPFLMGIWGSAFCATLSHYYKEVRPMLRSIAGFSNFNNLVESRDDDLSKVHPIQPAAFPNFVRGLQYLLPDTVPDVVDKTEHIELMDAGMSNNLPIYPLLRPGRNVDVIIAFDASADVKTDNWLSVVDGYAKQRGIKGWPIGAGWPKEDTTVSDAVTELEAADHSSLAESDRNVEHTQKKEAADGSASGPPDRQGLADAPMPEETGRRGRSKSRDLSYCNVWVGSTQERRSHIQEKAGKEKRSHGSAAGKDQLGQASSPQSPSSSSSSAASARRPKSHRRDSSKLVEEEWELMSPGAGICVVYFPLLPNKSARLDPSTGPSSAATADLPRPDTLDPRETDFMSTWNFVYRPAEIDAVAALARANFAAGQDQTRRTIRAVYERKRRARLERDALDRQEMLRDFFSRPSSQVPAL